MAKKQTAEDDEEGFGDFKFVVTSPSVYPNLNLQFSQINDPNFFTASNDNDNDNDNDNEDDEWGDFIDNSSPITAKSDLSGGLSSTGSHPTNPSNHSKPIDPFTFFSYNSPTNTNRADVMEMNRAESDKKQWIKPQGALPLSIFGDVEEENEQEERSGVCGASDLVDRKRVDLKENGSSLNLGTGINDTFANLANQTERISDENGLNSTSNGFNSILSTGNKIEQIKPENELSVSSNGLNSNSKLNGFGLFLNGLNDVSREYNEFEQANVKNESIYEPNALNSNSNGLDSSLSSLDSNINGGNEDFDDDDGWEFQGAGSGNNRGDLNSEVDQKGQGNSEVAEYTSMFGNGAHGSTDLFVVSNGISFKPSELVGSDFKPSNVAQNGFIFESHARSQQNEYVIGNPHQSDGNIDTDDNLWEFKDAFAETESKHKPGIVADTGFMSDVKQSISKQNEAGSESFPLPIDGKIDSDDFFWEFKDANSEFESKPKEEAEAADYSNGEFDVSSLDGQMQTNKTMTENQQGALPLSLFSEGKLDTDDSFNLQDSFAYKPTSNLRNGIGSHSPSISFDDLILNLYSQAENKPSVNSIQKPTINGLESIPMVLDSNIVNNDDDFEDNSWEFKDALSDTSAKDQSPVPIAGNTPSVNSTQKPTINGLELIPMVLDSNIVNNDDDFDDNSWGFKDALADTSAKDQSHDPIAGNTHVTKLKMESYTEFYTKLKDELYHIAYFHLDSLKKAKTAAALCGDDTKVGALDDEIQGAYKEMHLENILFEVYTENHSPRTNCFHDFLGILLEPKFQVLESEYHLSRRLTLAKKDLKSAIEVLGHATSMLKLLTSGSVEEQSNYVTAWSTMISICAQELKHGASIWKQALQKNVHRQILFEPRGQEFIVALGEIYRVVKVIGASTELYKPWMLSNLADPASIFALLEECSTLWSSSGLEEALQNISNPIGFEYEGTIKALLESIKHVHDLDALSFEGYLLVTQDPICRLSLLTPAVLSDMKLVVWNGEHYFLKLVNLWANLISSDPPKLMHIHIG